VADAWGRRSDSKAHRWRRLRCTCSCMGAHLRERLSTAAGRPAGPGPWSAPAQPRSTSPPISLGAAAYVVSDDAFPSLRSMLHPMPSSHMGLSPLPAARQGVSRTGSDVSRTPLELTSQRQEIWTPDQFKPQEHITTKHFTISPPLPALFVRAAEMPRRTSCAGRDINANTTLLVFNGVNTFSRGGGCNRGSRSFFPFTASSIIHFIPLHSFASFLSILFPFLSSLARFHSRSRFSLFLFVCSSIASVSASPDVCSRARPSLWLGCLDRAPERGLSLRCVRVVEGTLSHPCTARVRGLASTIGTVY
jgi:hypothetical protein